MHRLLIGLCACAAHASEVTPHPHAVAPGAPLRFSMGNDVSIQQLPLDEVAAKSNWNPHLPARIDAFLAAFAAHYDQREMESVLIGMSGDFGEAIYNAIAIVEARLARFDAEMQALAYDVGVLANRAWAMPSVHRERTCTWRTVDAGGRITVTVRATDNHGAMTLSNP